MSSLTTAAILVILATVLVSLTTAQHGLHSGGWGEEEPRQQSGEKLRHSRNSRPQIRRTKLSGKRKYEPSLMTSQAPTMATKHFKPLYTAKQKDRVQSRRPNIILFLTDDQDVELGSLQFMPKLNKHVKEKGAIFNNGFVSTPMCCPSRSSLLTGLYVHNHKVFTNNDNCSSVYWQQEHEPRSFGAYLQDSGYSTGYFGKYLNKYTGQYVPPGWGEWQGLVRNSRFYNYSLNINGQLHHHGQDYATDYLPDLITNRTINFIRSSKDKDSVTPVLAVMSYPGPHGPEEAAPQYQHLFFNVTTHHTPAYDFAPNPDKQWILRHTDKMQPVHKHFTDLLMTKRLQTLQTVDDAVERVVSVLEELGELDNTYIFYTSDHGYHLGQYGLVKGKAFPFDVDTRVPFLVRGPGIAANSANPALVGNIDLAPTFIDIAGMEKPPHMDGESILATVSPPDPQGKPWRSAFLLERGKMTFERYAKVSNSAANDVIGMAGEDSDSLTAAGILSKDRLTKQERLEIECKKSRYQTPCQSHQKWFCRARTDGSIRMTRCRSRIQERWGSTQEARRRSSSRGNRCHCQPGEIFGWRYTKLDLEEKRNQKKFLKAHVPQARKITKKFLKTLPSAVSGQRVTRRSTASQLAAHPGTASQLAAHLGTAAAAASQDDLAGMFEDVHHEEIEEVDGLVEDIAEEIRDLHNLKNASNSDVPCRLARHNVICSTNVIQDQRVWENSRSTIKLQIQRLRAQLLELKQIRKYLRLRRPKVLIHGRELHLKEEEEELHLEKELQSATNSEICLCEEEQEEGSRRKMERLRRREEKKVERLRRKERKRLKLQKKEKRRNSPVKKNEHCKEDAKMNCFSHDNDHWKTAPFWTEGPFCACTNSNNNTYWCARNVNSTHNYLYCEYVTGMITYFDLRVDPHQLRNVLHTLTDTEVNYMHSQVLQLREFSAEALYLEARTEALEGGRARTGVHGEARTKHRNRRWRRRNLAAEFSRRG